MIIDSHQHFWKYDPVTQGWIDENMKKIRKDFLPADLKPVYDELGIQGCVAVQADQTERETEFLLSLADQYPFIKAVVGWVDLCDEDLEKRLEYFKGFEKLAGFRHILQAEPPEKMLEPDFLRGINQLQKYNFTYDILIFPKHLEAAIELVQKFPNQKYVVDHLAKPHIKDGFIESWAKKMGHLAKSENVSCKISGMVTEADWHSWDPADFKPYLDEVFELFGPQRLMFGSDWPVCKLAGSLKEVYSIVTEYLADFSSHEKEAVLGKNALNFYGIE